MGNWRTVTMMGTCPADQLGALRDLLCIDYMSDGFEDWGPLSYSSKGSLFGLNAWPAATIARSGNLAERDYGPEDVAWHLHRCLEVAPGLRLKVHCGDDWEATNCVATVTAEDGAVTVGPPEVAEVAGVSVEEGVGRLLNVLHGAGKAIREDLP